MNELEGGFVNTTSIKGTSLSAGLSIDHTRGKVFGWSCGYSAFNKSFQFGYPITMTGITPPSDHYVTGYVMRAHEIQWAFLMRLGKHINLSVGPYVQINTDDIISGMGVDEDFYYPSLPQDLYNNIELGYQGFNCSFFLAEHSTSVPMPMQEHPRPIFAQKHGMMPGPTSPGNRKIGKVRR